MISLATILPLIEKGLAHLPQAIAIGKDVIPAISAMKNLVSHATAGTVTPEMVKSTEETLDGLIDRFNRPI